MKPAEMAGFLFQAVQQRPVASGRRPGSWLRRGARNRSRNTAAPRLRRMPTSIIDMQPRRSAQSGAPIPLVVRFGPVGDMVLQTPLFQLLHRRYGRPCNLLTSGSSARALFAGHPDVGEIWQLRRRHTPFLLSPERWRLASWLRTQSGPVYVTEDSQRQLRSLRRLLPIGRISSDRCVFIDAFPPTFDEHSVDQLLRFGNTTPTDFQTDFPGLVIAPGIAPQLHVLAQDREDRERWLQQRGLAGYPLVLLQPGNKQAAKSRRARLPDPKIWPIARWVELLQAMHAQVPAARFVLSGSPEERSLLEEIGSAAELDCVVIASDDLPLRRLLAVLETAHSMVSVDSGPAHIAAAIGCPVIVLYGQASRKRWGRRSPSNTPVIELGGAPLHHTASEIPASAVIKAWTHLHATRLR